MGSEDASALTAVATRPAPPLFPDLAASPSPLPAPLGASAALPPSVLKTDGGEKAPTSSTSDLSPGTRTAATLMVYSERGSRPLTRH